jgi:hypothetical protein
LNEHAFTIDLGTSGPKVAIYTIDGMFVDGDSEPVGTRLTAEGGADRLSGGARSPPRRGV